MIREQMADEVARDPDNQESQMRLRGWDSALGFKMISVHKRGRRHLRRRQLVRVMHTDESGREHTVFYKDRNDGRGPRLMAKTDTGDGNDGRGPRLVAKTDTGDGNGIRIRPYYFD